MWDKKNTIQLNSILQFYNFNLEMCYTNDASVMDVPVQKPFYGVGKVLYIYLYMVYQTTLNLLPTEFQFTINYLAQVLAWPYFLHFPIKQI